MGKYLWNLVGYLMEEKNFLLAACEAARETAGSQTALIEQQTAFVKKQSARIERMEKRLSLLFAICKHYKEDLAAEKVAHQATKDELTAEKAARRATEEALATEEVAHEETTAELAAEKAAHQATLTELAAGRDANKKLQGALDLFVFLRRRNSGLSTKERSRLQKRIFDAGRRAKKQPRKK